MQKHTPMPPIRSLFPKKGQNTMKLVRHYEAVIAIFERAWEKAYVLAHRGEQEWVPLYLPDQPLPCAEIHVGTRAVRLCPGNHIQTEQAVLFHILD